MASILETSWTQSVHPELDAPARPPAPALLSRWRLVIALRFRERAADRAVGQDAGELIGGEPVARLGRPDGLAFVGQRGLAEGEPGLPRQQADGRRQVREPIAQIRAEADERLVHGTASCRNRSSIACARSSAGSGQLSPPWWACACSPGPKLAAGIPTRASCATSVQACLASIGAAVTARNSCNSGLSKMAGAAGARSVTAAVAPKRRARAIT